MLTKLQDQLDNAEKQFAQAEYLSTGRRHAEQDHWRPIIARLKPTIERRRADMEELIG